MPDPKDDRLFKSYEMVNVFDPKVAQELFDEAMGENGKKAALITQKDAEIAELKEDNLKLTKAANNTAKTLSNVKLIAACLVIAFLIAFGHALALNAKWKSAESRNIADKTEKTVASDKINTSSFDAAAKGRALTPEELADYEGDRVADRGVFLASWYDKERIVVVDHNDKHHYLKLTQDVYSALKNKSGYALDVQSAIYLLEEGFIDERDRDRAKAKEKAREFMRSQEKKTWERRMKIQEIIQEIFKLRSSKKEAPKPKPEPIEY